MAPTSNSETTRMTETHRTRDAKRRDRSGFMMLLIAVGAVIAGVVVAVGFAPPAFAVRPETEQQGAGCDCAARKGHRERTFR